MADFVLIGVGIGLLSRGSFQNLKKANIPYFWVIILGFVIKFSSSFFPMHLFNWFNIIGMIIVLIGTLLSSKSYGMKTVTVGALLNLLVILFNQGSMPVSLPVVRFLHLDELAVNLEKGLYPDYSLLTSATHLPFLSDILPYYSLILRRPFVISAGDYLLGAGLIAFIVFYMRREDRQ